MALQAGRVGVRNDQVDLEGRIIGAGAEIDERLDALESEINTVTDEIGDDDISEVGDSITNAISSLNDNLANIYPFDTTPTSGITKGVTSSGVYSAIYSLPVYKMSNNIILEGVDLNLKKNIAYVVFGQTFTTESSSFIATVLGGYDMTFANKTSDITVTHNDTKYTITSTYGAVRVLAIPLFNQ